MRRALAGKPNSRATIAAHGAGALLALLIAAPASALTPARAGSPAYGGTQVGAVRPVITGVQCISRCAASSASRGSRAVGVRDAGVVKIRGRNMSAVRAVIFTGAAGTRDDVRVSPRGVGRLSVDVTVPSRAPTGRVVLFSSPAYSSPSSQAIQVVHRDRSDVDPRNNGAPSVQGLIWPVPRAPLFGVFGENRGSHLHSGIDIGASSGTPVRAAAAGTVLFVGPEGGYGNFVCVAHRTISTCYAHLSDFATTVGASVSQGELLGHSGCTGNCSGPHLHFEVRNAPRLWATPVNPMIYLPGGATSARASAATGPLDFDLPVNGPGR